MELVREPILGSHGSWIQGTKWLCNEVHVSSIFYRITRTRFLNVVICSRQVTEPFEKRAVGKTFILLPFLKNSWYELITWCEIKYFKIRIKVLKLFFWVLTFNYTYYTQCIIKAFIIHTYFTCIIYKNYTSRTLPVAQRQWVPNWFEPRSAAREWKLDSSSKTIGPASTITSPSRNATCNSITRPAIHNSSSQRRKCST